VQHLEAAADGEEHADAMQRLLGGAERSKQRQDGEERNHEWQRGDVQPPVIRGRHLRVESHPARDSMAPSGPAQVSELTAAFLSLKYLNSSKFDLR